MTFFTVKGSLRQLRCPSWLSRAAICRSVPVSIQMRQPFEPSQHDREPKFYSMPQPALPPKELERAAPQFHRRQAQNDA
jgi:hypothetical protein